MIGKGHETAFGQFGRVRSAFGESGETECESARLEKTENELENEVAASPDVPGSHGARDGHAVERAQNTHNM